MKASRVGGNVYRIQGAGGNIAACVGDDGIALVDDKVEPLVEQTESRLLLALRSLPLSGQRIRSDFVVLKDSVQTQYLDADPHSDKPALVLIPGWRFSAGIWKPQIDHFSVSRRVVAIDPRSQGESTKTTEGDTPEVRAQDLA
jgi:hypothetical protein